MGKTFAEKIFNAPKGSIVFKKPDIILSHDNTASIEKIFQKMGGGSIANPNQLLNVLDHNAPPTTSKLANDYQSIREFVEKNKIEKFHDVGSGICHQLMGNYAEPGMVIVGSDSHTCTAGAFNAFAAGIDRTETAGIWKKGEAWFRVPETIKIELTGKLNEYVSAKDIALWIIGMIGASGADYMSIEYHGDGIKHLSISDRMTITNLASEMGAKNAVFPPGEILKKFYNNKKVEGVWADDDATYYKTIDINLNDIYPVVACPHQVDNVKSISDVEDIPVQQALIGTCTNGRIEDLRAAAKILKGKKIAHNMQLLITPASKDIYKSAMKEGIIELFLEAGANILSPSCGPCLGTGQGIPADGTNVISTANRNFLGRMGNKNANIYLASPETVAYSAITGKISNPGYLTKTYTFPYSKKESPTIEIGKEENRYLNHVWDYHDADNLNTDQMFAGNLTYTVNSSEPEQIVPHLFKGFDSNFAEKAQKGDIMICGYNFGCGSSREHPSVGLAYKGIKAVIVKSVSRIFFRSAINQGLPVIVYPELVDKYSFGDSLNVNIKKGEIILNDNVFKFNPLPDRLLEIFECGGLVNWMQKNT